MNSKTDWPEHNQEDDDDGSWLLFFRLIFHSAFVVSVLGAICLVFVEKNSAEFVVSVVTVIISSSVVMLSGFAVKRRWFPKKVITK